jgi:hypothetical protein
LKKRLQIETRGKMKSSRLRRMWSCLFDAQVCRNDGCIELVEAEERCIGGGMKVARSGEAEVGVGDLDSR